MFPVHPIAIGLVLASSGGAAPIPDEVLVRFRPGVAEPDAGRALAALGARQTGYLAALRVRRVKLPPGLDAGTALARLRARPDVDAADYNLRVHTAGSVTIVDDFANIYYAGAPVSATQWGLQQIGALAAWNAGIPNSQGSPNVVVAVVDSGVSSTHPELSGQLVTGANFVNTTNPPDDDNGHGTFVASLVAAKVGNGAMMGVAPSCRIMPVKVVDASGSGDEFTELTGALWAAQNGAQVINLSLSSCSETNGQVDCPPGTLFGVETMQQIWSLGTLVVAATGNEATNQTSYPAGYPNVVGVAATDPNDRLAPYSNYGNDTLLAAPGGLGSIYACDPTLDVVGASLGAASPCAATIPLATAWCDTGAGTSFASPHVAGAAAVLLAANPGLTNAQLVSRLEATADQPEGGSGWNERYGYGRINLYRALLNQVSAQPSDGMTAWAYPNPFDPKIGPVRFVIPNGSGQDIRVEVFDALGRKVWSRHDQAADSAGKDYYWHSDLAWDGKNAGGVDAANGLYLVRLTVGSTSIVKKIALVR